MANNSIKSLLDNIIDDTENTYPSGNVKSTIIGPAHNGFNPVTFDRGKFKEKLSLYVLKDLVCAMMHDETNNMDDMIDSSILNHIHNDYDGTCYGYLCTARDRLKSPTLGDIIQEIDDVTADVEEDLQMTKDPDHANIDIQSILGDVENYEELRKRLKAEVSKKVVDDVSRVISKSNDAPVFDDLDEKLQEKENDETDTAGLNTDIEELPADEEGMSEDMDAMEPVSVSASVSDEATSESVIFRLCGAIVTEYAIENKGQRISTEEGLNRAIVEYCINEMDYLFKMDPNMSIYARYDI